MTTVLIAVDDSDTAVPVLETGRALADLLGGAARAVHVREPGTQLAEAAPAAASVPLEVHDGDPVEVIVRAAGRDDVAVVIVGARGTPEGPRPVGHIAMTVAERLPKPVLVVPPDAARDPSAAIRRALIPLEGTPESTAAVTDALHQLATAGVELVAVHVLGGDTVPAFWDQPAYAAESYAAEFAARWCEEPDVELRLRRGTPSTTVVDVAGSEAVDLIALAWSQQLAPGRAPVVRAVLERARTPVLLVPVPSR